MNIGCGRFGRSMKPDDQQPLREAIARAAGAVVSFPIDGQLRHHKTRFVAAAEEGFWIEAPAEDRELINGLMATGKPVGITLRSGTIKIVLTTMILQFRVELPRSDGTPTPALLLAWPAQVKSIQRRAGYRVNLPPGAPIAVRVWPIPEYHYLRDRPPTATKIDVTLRNLSIGGMGLVYSPAADAAPLESNQRLRIQISHPSGDLLVEGRVKHVRKLPDNELGLGVQFKKLEDGFEGRQTLFTLTQIVGRLQRDEIRRTLAPTATAEEPQAEA